MLIIILWLSTMSWYILNAWIFIQTTTLDKTTTVGHRVPIIYVLKSTIGKQIKSKDVKENLNLYSMY